MILNIHTHLLVPDPQAVIDISGLVYNTRKPFEIPAEFDGYTQLFSVGIHPWHLVEDIPDGLMEAVEATAAMPEVAMIGEAGMDIPKGGPLYRQMQIFRFLIELSEKHEKPLLIHNVKAHDLIIQLHRDLHPSQTWVIHGFRNKPAVAGMFLREGMKLSFGPQFNAMTVKTVPSDSILAETDASEEPISEVIHSLSDARGIDLTHTVADNAGRLLRLPEAQ